MGYVTMSEIAYYDPAVGKDFSVIAVSNGNGKVISGTLVDDDQETLKKSFIKHLKLHLENKIDEILETQKRLLCDT